MPRKRKVVLRSVQATHLRFLGISPHTLLLYRRAVHEFFVWRRRTRQRACRDYADLDLQLAAYVNELYAQGDPMDRAANVLSGIKRFIPRARRCLDIASLFYSNWAKITPRKRALPLKAEWAQAFSSYVFAQGHPTMSLLILVGFLGFFRIQELLHMQFSQLLWTADDCCYVVITDSKGAKLKGEAEHVRLVDAGLLRVLRAWGSKARPYDLIFPVEYAQVLTFLRGRPRTLGCLLTWRPPTV